MSTHETPPPRLMLKSTKDALLIIEAAERGLFPRLVRRLTEQERAESIFSGAIFVYDEFESHIKRFTDTLVWSPSRIVGNYLVYREMRKHEPRPASRAAAALPPQPPAARSLARPRPESIMNQSERGRKQREQIYVGSLTNSDRFKPDGLVKRTFSLMTEGKHIHVIAYYTYNDAMNESFITPSEHPQFGELPISQDLLRDKSAYRVPPRIETLSNGQLAYAGEDSDKPASPRSESTSLDTDRDSPSTGGTPDISSLSSLPPVELQPQEGSMYELPPLRPIIPRSNWNEISSPALDGPAYSTQTRSEPAPYSFSNNSSSLTPSLAAISIPSLTPPPTRAAPRLRDARQTPYPAPRCGRPNAHNLNVARVHREPEHTPTDPSFAPDSAVVFNSEFGSTPPPYHEGSISWALPQIGFDNGGFGARREHQRAGGSEIAAPVPIRPRAYEVGPSGERVEYDPPTVNWGPVLFPDRGSGGAGSSTSRNENRGGYH